MRPAIVAAGVLTAIDVLKAVARHGAPTLDELDDAFTDPAPGYSDALDLAVDGGYLHVIPYGPSVTDNFYRLSSRGRRLLRASASASLAA